jgi:hypothetical protein
MSPGFFTGAMAFLLTLMVLSYLVGDNPLFRIAVYVFVGVAAGYVAAVAFWQVLYPDLIVPLVRGTSMQRVTLAVPLLLIGLLLMKAWPGLTRLGMPAMGLLVGAAAAAAIGGAVAGTLFPQVQATIDPFSPKNLPFPDVLFNGAVVLAGVVATLAYFHFGARTTQDGSVRRLVPVEMIAAVGSIFVAITLGVLFAGVYSAALTAMIERLHFLASFVGLG